MADTTIPDQSMAWYDLALIEHLPWPHRLYAWWVKNGFKRQDGFTWGGNRSFNLLRHLYKFPPGRDKDYISIPAYQDRFEMVIDLTDFEVPHHTFLLSIGKDSETRLLELLFPRGGIFVDVGANYGFYSLIASYLGGRDSIVHAYEPQSRLVKALEKSKERNQFGQLRVKAVLLGERSGFAEFYIPDTGSGVGSIFREHAGRFRPVEKKIVPIETLDMSLKAERLTRLDVIKIDVEGSELAVMKGATGILTEHQPLVWFEMNPEAQAIANQDQEHIYSLLADVGYEGFYNIEDVASGVFRPIRRVDKLTNVLAVPSGKLDLVRTAVLNPYG